MLPYRWLSTRPCSIKRCPALAVPGLRTCFGRPCVPLSSCSTWYRHQWRPTTSSCPTPRGTPRTPRDASAPTRWPAARSLAMTMPHRGCLDMAPSVIHTPTRTLIPTLTQTRLMATLLWLTRRSLQPSLRQDTPTRLKGRCPQRQREDSVKKSAGGWISN